MSNDSWPEELVKKPKPLIALAGLDVESNQIHNSIWDGFSKIRRQDRAPLNFGLFSVKHEYPKCKPKRNTYEWYVPKGILKAKWMLKHMDEVPSMIVIFFDMDWDDFSWKEKVNDCSNMVSTIKKNVQGRPTKIVVVLIQKRVLMPGEDSHAEQKAQYLCQVCDLPGVRTLFLLPTTETLLGYITRLEREFQDLSHNYYQSLIKKVKSHKETLNKTTHQLLFIRHHFKIAFYQEFRQEHALALKNYKQAYMYLIELRMLDPHILEIKTVAGYINYKICCLSFQNNASDAISQFRRHTDFFKSTCGVPELIFEHESWMSKQFEVMGDLFRDAIRQGLTAITTQHPGLYYEEAALHAIARKSYSHSNMISSARRVIRYYNVTEASYISTNLSDLKKSVSDIKAFQEPLEFYGQRHWRQGRQSIELPDPIKEKEAIAVLQLFETEVDHSKIIIPLLRNAMEHYQRYKANRMKLMSCVLMGEEYMDCRDFLQALKCFNKVINEYRSERWNSLLTSTLLNSLKCTFVIAQLPDYISICLELINETINLNPVEKMRIQSNLNRVLNNEIPDPENCFSSQQIDEAATLWKKKLVDFKVDEYRKDNFCINMNEIQSSVDCKVVFPAYKFHVNKSLEFSIFLRCTTILPLPIRNIEIYFTDVRYNERYSFSQLHCVPSDLRPFAITEFKFLITPITDDGSHTIKVEKVFVQIGDSNSYGHAFLQWTINLDDYFRQVFQPLEAVEFQPKNSLLPWSAILVLPFVEVVPRLSEFSVSIYDAGCILVNECYPFQITVVNNELCDVCRISLVIVIEEKSPIPNHQASKVNFLPKIKTECSSVVVKSSEKKRIELEITSSSPGEQVSEIICATASTIGAVRFSVEVGYKIRINVGDHSGLCQCVKSECLETTVIQPFETFTKLLSPFMIPMKDIIYNEPFLFQLSSSNASPVKIEIVKTEIFLASDIMCLDNDSFSDYKVSNEIVESLESVSEVYMLNVLPNASDDVTVVSLGKYVIYWKRIHYGLCVLADCYSSVTNTYAINLPECNLDLSPLTADLIMDSCAVCKIPFTLTYALKNRTLYPLEVEAQLDMSDNFMYSGIKLIHLRVLPHSTYPLTFNLIPVIPGYLTLPRFHVKLIGSSTQQLLSLSASDPKCSSTQKISVDIMTTKDSAFVAQIANLERLFEDKFLSRLPSFIFAKPTGESKNFD